MNYLKKKVTLTITIDKMSNNKTILDGVKVTMVIAI